MEQDIEEYNALTATLLSFYNYHKYEYDQIIKPRLLKYDSLSEEDRQLIPWYTKHTEHLKMCININEEFTKRLAVSVALDWGVSTNPNDWAPSTNMEYDKVRSTMLQMAREWSSEGADERAVINRKIQQDILELYPENHSEVKILVPGCGLGRLVFDLVKEGYWCQGNEFSYHMLLASSFVLNHSSFAHENSIFPYLHKSSYLVKRLNQIRPVTFPDYNPLDIHKVSENSNVNVDELMSMAAGSFTDLYGPPGLSLSETYSNDPNAEVFRNQNKESYDVLVTCFFLDTASNIIDYLKTIYYSLKTGGRWINFGPLLWHFEDDYNAHYVDRKNDNGNIEKVPSIMKGLELSKEDLIDLVKTIGFEFEKHESEIESTYCADTKSLGAFIYKCEYWVCVKK